LEEFREKQQGFLFFLKKNFQKVGGDVTMFFSMTQFVRTQLEHAEPVTYIHSLSFDSFVVISARGGVYVCYLCR